MPTDGNGPKGPPRPTPARGNVTPSGYKNVRVFVPQALWYQLVSHSAASEMGLHDFVVAWLERATPLAPTPASQRHAATGPAPSQGHAQ